MDERELLIEQVAAAWRPERRDGALGTHPAWHDLDEAGRREAYQRALTMRRLESALHPEGLSTTAQAVLARIRGE